MKCGDSIRINGTEWHQDLLQAHHDPNKSRLTGYVTDMGDGDMAEIERALCKVPGIKTGLASSRT